MGRGTCTGPACAPVLRYGHAMCAQCVLAAQIPLMYVTRRGGRVLFEVWDQDFIRWTGAGIEGADFLGVLRLLPSEMALSGAWRRPSSASYPPLHPCHAPLPSVLILTSILILNRNLHLSLIVSYTQGLMQRPSLATRTPVQPISLPDIGESQ